MSKSAYIPITRHRDIQTVVQDSSVNSCEMSMTTMTSVLERGVELTGLRLTPALRATAKGNPISITVNFEIN